MDEREIGCYSAGGWTKVIAKLQIVMSTLALIVCVIGLHSTIQGGPMELKKAVKDTVLSMDGNGSFPMPPRFPITPQPFTITPPPFTITPPPFTISPPTLPTIDPIIKHSRRKPEITILEITHHRFRRSLRDLGSRGFPTASPELGNSANAMDVTILVISTAVAGVGIIMGVVLLKGSKKRNTRYLRWWIIFAAVCMVWDVIFAILNTTVSLGVTVVYLIFVLAIYCFGIWVVRVHMKEIERVKEINPYAAGAPEAYEFANYENI